MGNSKLTLEGGACDCKKLLEGPAKKIAAHRGSSSSHGSSYEENGQFPLCECGKFGEIILRSHIYTFVVFLFPKKCRYGINSVLGWTVSF